jgi:hypothetical protein
MMTVVPVAVDSLTRAKALLSASKRRDLRQLAVTQDGDAIKLSGCVSCYYHMQLAQELIRSELGDVVVNAMHVPRHDTDEVAAG